MENVPGTVKLQTSRTKNIVLVPEPSSDPDQPLNWSTFRKTVHMTILCIYCVLIFAIVTVAIPLWAAINADIGISYDDLNNGYAAQTAALAVGCIFCVPLAIRFGRRPVYIITSIIMTASAIWMAETQTVGDWIGSNFISGFAGCVNEALFQMTVTDLFFVHQRGTINGVYLIVVLIGNYFGPVAAGYAVVSLGWRWVFWICAILMGVTTLAITFLLEESQYHVQPIIGEEALSRPSTQEIPYDKEQASDVKTAEEIVPQTKAHRNVDHTLPLKSFRQRLSLYTITTDSTPLSVFMLHHITQPFKILIQFPAVAFTALQYGWTISMLVMLALVQGTLLPLPPYNFSPIGVGNMNIPPVIGAVLGSIFGGPLNDLVVIQVAKRRDGIYKPETRLWLFLVPGMAMVIGAFVFGLTIAQGMPWIVNAIGAGFIGFAVGGCGDMSLTYVQDSYQYILGDALVGVVFVRNGLATAFSFALPPWAASMGEYNIWVILGVLSLIVALTCVPFWFYGERWRARLAGKYALYAQK